MLNEIFTFFERLISEMLPFSVIVFGGLYISIKGRFFQFKGLISSFFLVNKAIKTPKKKGEITSFSAACTALSATVGTGNIAGVAGALSLGGAGAIFWMWISSFTGMAVKYGEIALSVKYREKIKEKEYAGGPMYYINKLKRGDLASFAFSFAALPAVICSGNITQTNAAATVLGEDNICKYIVGISFFMLTPLVIWGGVSRIGAVTEKIVPIMSLLYVIMSLGVIILNKNALPEAFGMIFKGAFSPKAVTGGAVGSLIQSAVIGAQRGVFSNEAGLGTSAMAHSTAYDANCKTQGLFGIFEIFIDTIVLCTLTALTILCSGVNIEYGTVASSSTVSVALSSAYGNISSLLLTVMMSIFAFSSIIGWAVYGHICSGHIFGKKGQIIFKIIYPLGCLIGAFCNADFAWRLSAFFNGIMLCINVPSVILMTDNYLFERRKKVDKQNKGNSKHFRDTRSRSHNLAH